MLRRTSCHPARPCTPLGLLLLACVFLCLQGCGKSYIDSGAPVRYGAASGAAVVKTARTQLGAPYKYGGVSPKTGFDCSGFIVWSYQQYGVPMPRRAEVTHTVTVRSRSFAFLREFRGGEVIPARNTLIALDGEVEIRTPHDDCLLVMPTPIVDTSTGKKTTARR